LSRPDDEVLGKAYDARLMARLWGVTRPHKRLVILSLVLFPLTAGVELVGPYLVKLAIDHHILAGDWVGLTGMAVLFLITLGALYLLRVAQAYVTQLTGQRVMHDLRHALFAHLQRLDAAFFDRNPVGRLMTRVLSDAEAINEMFTSGMVSIVGDVVTLTGVVVVLLLLNWKLALVTFALVPLLAVAAAYFRIKARDCYRIVRVRLAALSAFLQESIQGMSVIQLFARERQEAAAFASLNGALRAGQFRSTLYDASLYAIVEAMGSAAVALLLWYGGGEVLAGALTFGGLVAFIEYTSRFFLPIRDLGAKYAVMQAAMVSAERVFGLLDTPPAVVGGRHAGGAPSAARPAVEFRDVSFAYPGGPPVLHECSFRIGPAERVALVGPTGEGKTTVARLMTRTYDVAAGQVLVDGVDVREWDVQALRRHVGLVPQEPFLFTGTIRENLVLGRDGGRDGNGDGSGALEAALARAQAARLVAGLPGGLDAVVRERGVNLSQGQRQLLAIARALIYNPRVLALDEATSSVDAESETLIRAAVAELLQDRASLIIAHRLSTIQSADRILVLHHGRVREAGRHAELLAAGGIYARLYEMQFGREPA
jgi:ATP-binding cassette subfamily B protein